MTSPQYADGAAYPVKMPVFIALQAALCGLVFVHGFSIGRCSAPADLRKMRHERRANKDSDGGNDQSK